MQKAMYLIDETGYFNSIKVRLELTAYHTNIENAQFQFHKGAIRTLYLLCSVVDVTLISIP